MRDEHILRLLSKAFERMISKVSGNKVLCLNSTIRIFLEPIVFIYLAFKLNLKLVVYFLSSEFKLKTLANKQ